MSLFSGLFSKGGSKAKNPQPQSPPAAAQFFMFVNSDGKQVFKAAPKSLPINLKATLEKCLGSGQVVVELVDENECQYLPEADGSFISLEPGRYIIKASQSMGISSDNVCRALAVVQDLHTRDEPLHKTITLHKHDLEFTACTHEDAYLRYTISTTRNNRTIVVGIDAGAHTSLLLDVRLEAFDEGAAADKVAFFAGILPFGTILQLLDSDGQSDEKVTPTVIFTGKHFGGSVAHLAAILLRRTVTDRKLNAVVLAVAFSPVSCVDAVLKAKLDASQITLNHLSIYWGFDPEVVMMNQCLDTTAAVGRHQGQGTFSVPTLIQQVAEARGMSSPKEIAAIKDTLARGADIARVVFNDRLPVFMPLGQCCFNYAGSLQVCNADGAVERFKGMDLNTLGRVPPGFPVTPEMKFNGNPLAAPVPVKDLPLQPTITDVKALRTDNFTQFTIEGTYLDAVLQRHHVQCFIAQAGSELQAPIFLNADEFGTSPGTDAKFEERQTTLLKVQVKQTKGSTGHLRVRTDFGSSDNFHVKDCKRAETASVAAVAAARIGTSLFRSALLRTLLDKMGGSPRPKEAATTTLRDYRDYLVELEKLLLNPKQSTIDAVMSRYQSADPSAIVYACESTMGTIRMMTAELEKSISIDSELTSVRALRKVLGAVAWFASGVLTIVATVAAIPGALLMLPLTMALDREDRSNTVVALSFIPGVLGAVAGGGPALLAMGLFMLHQRARAALSDPATRQYAQVLKFLLKLMNVEQDFLDEVPTLEDQIVRRFSYLSQGSLSISEANEEQIRGILETMEKEYPQEKPKVFGLLPSKGKTEVIRWVKIVGKIVALRVLLARQCVISFVGTHNAGKSTVIHEMFGFQTGADLVKRTEVPCLHRLKHAAIDNVASQPDQEMKDPLAEFKREEKKRRDFSVFERQSSLGMLFPTSSNRNSASFSVSASASSSSSPSVSLTVSSASPTSSSAAAATTSSSSFAVSPRPRSTVSVSSETKLPQSTSFYVGRPSSLSTATASSASTFDVSPRPRSTVSVSSETKLPQSTSFYGGRPLAAYFPVSTPRPRSVTHYNTRSLRTALCGSENLLVDVLDFPGASDEREFVANMTGQIGDASSMFVIIFSAGHIAGPERKITATILSTEKPFIVLINKQEIIQDELRTRKDEIRKDYADRLGIAPELIFFITAKNKSDIDKVRSYIYVCMSLHLENRNDQASLACALLRPDVREQLEQKKDDPMFMLQARRAVQLMMKNEDPILMEDLVNYVTNYVPAAGESRNEPSSPLRLRLMVLMTELGFPSTTTMVTMRLLNEPDKLVAFAREHPALTLDTNEAETMEFVIAVASLVSTVLAGHEKSLLAMDYPEAEVRAGLEYASAHLTLSLPNIVDIIDKIQRREIQPQAPANLSDADRRNHLRLLTRYKLPDVKTVQPDQKISELSYEQRTELFRRQAPFLRLQEQEKSPGSSPCVLILKSSQLLISLLDELMNFRAEALRGGVTIKIADDAAIDIGGVLRGTFTQAAQELIEGKFHPCSLREETKVVYFRECFNLVQTQTQVSRCPQGHNLAEFTATSAFKCHGCQTMQRDGAPMIGCRRCNLDFCTACCARQSLNGEKKGLVKRVQALGRLLGLCLLHCDQNVTFPAKLAVAMFKPILGIPVNLDDLSSIDPILANTLRGLFFSDEKLLAELDLTFTVEVDGRTMALEPGGENLRVNARLCPAYLQKRVGFHLCHVEFPMREFVAGFHEIVPPAQLAMFTPVMLQLLVCGLDLVDADLILDGAVWSYPLGGDKGSKLREWFEQCVRDMSPADISLLLAFITGASTVVPGTPLLISIVVRRDPGDLPVSHTCFNMLELAPYTSPEELSSKLLMAIRNTSAAQFGFM